MNLWANQETTPKHFMYLVNEAKSTGSVTVFPYKSFILNVKCRFMNDLNWPTLKYRSCHFWYAVTNIFQCNSSFFFLYEVNLKEQQKNLRISQTVQVTS